MKKITKMNEAAWVFGVLLCALGVALVTKANFGLSMIAAPAYILHVGISRFFPWYSQGTSEYFFQAALLILLCFTIQRFRIKYLFSFLTAVLFGLTLDFWFLLLGGNGAYAEFWMRILSFCLGELFTGAAIALFFRTRLPLQIYELIVTEFSNRYHLKMNRVKQVYDFASLILSLLLALLVNHSLTGIGVGTVILTIINAPVISLFGRLFDRCFTFDNLIMRKTDVNREGNKRK